jgi:hypothetical protein
MDRRTWGLTALLFATSAAAAGPRMESGVVLMPGETLVAPPGPVNSPRPTPVPAPAKPAPARVPQSTSEETRRDSYARSSRSVCVNCAVVTAIDRGEAQWEVRLRFDDGTRETLRLHERPRVRVGDAVHVEDGRLFRD